MVTLGTGEVCGGQECALPWLGHRHRDSVMEQGPLEVVSMEAPPHARRARNEAIVAVTSCQPSLSVPCTAGTQPQGCSRLHQADGQSCEKHTSAFQSTRLVMHC